MKYKMNCERCNKEFEYSRKKHPNRIRKYCSLKCSYDTNHDERRGKTFVEKVSLICKLCGKEYKKWPCVAKNSKYCSRKCHNIGNFLNMKKERTGIELQVERMLLELGIEFEQQKLLETLTVADFFVNPNVAIYVDGTYWHNRPEVKGRDQYVNKVLLSKGFNLVRISEEELESSPEKVKQRLIDIFGANHARSIA